MSAIVRGVVKDRTGQRYGRLIALEDTGERTRGGAVWLCQCDCGTTVHVRAGNLGRSTFSCGCLQRERAVAASRTHGHCEDGQYTPTYRSWLSLRKRCLNPQPKDYEFYGGRGIELRYASFEEFFADVGERPDGTSIDRIDNDGHYAPDNCRWATPTEQAANRRRRRFQKAPAR